MLLNRFYINIIIRVALIVVTGIALGLVITHLGHEYYFTLTGVTILIAVQTYLLIDQVNKTNKDLEKFFSSVQDNDTAIRFSDNMKNSSFGKLYERMNRVNKIIQASRLENERNRHFLQLIVDHVDIGLLSFNNDGTVGCLNRAAKKLLKVQRHGQLSSIEKYDGEFYRVIKSIESGQEILFKKNFDNHIQSILMKAAEINFETNRIKLVSFENITGELDRKELDSWQRLIRVLTHEIMNSLSPVTSLSSVISGYFKDTATDTPVRPEQISHQTILKTLSGLNTIEETGKGLLDFVTMYRSLTLLPKPKAASFKVDSLFVKCKLLMEADLPADLRIASEVIPEDMAITADYAQVEQVLINLIKNSVEALNNRKDGTIHLKAFYGSGGKIIQVEDNGPGIPEDIMEDIFVPFYTTRENGSGIGLSLSKQIMQNHDGTITAESLSGTGTRITLKFRG